MNRMSAKQRAKFAAMGIKYPTSTIAPKQPKKTASRQVPARRPTDTGPDKETVEAVRARDQFRCVCCGDPCPGRRGVEWSISHRKLRAQGVDNRMANLMLSCGNGSWGCESEIHRGPERARQAGWMLRSTENPEEIPMEHAVHGTVLLDNDGGFAVIQAITVEEPDVHPF